MTIAFVQVTPLPETVTPHQSAVLACDAAWRAAVALSDARLAEMEAAFGLGCRVQGHVDAWRKACELADQAWRLAVQVRGTV
jgi:hypothetical protein